MPKTSWPNTKSQRRPYKEFDDAAAAKAYVEEQGVPIVIKADGLAAGKGVTVAFDQETAFKAIDESMVDGVFGEAGARVVIEAFLKGEEASILAFADGKHVLPMATSQDHKPALDGDKGPNTGGMGAYSPAPVVTEALFAEIQEKVLQPCIDGMAAEGSPYTGILYAGLMITENGPEVVEFNVRFGDPETQVVLPRMKSDIVPIFLACCEGALEDCAIEYSADPCVTVVMASGGYPAAYEKGKEITGIDAAEEEAGVTVFHAGTKEADGILQTNGGRVLNVTASASDLPKAIKKAYTAVKAIHFDAAPLPHRHREKGPRPAAISHQVNQVTPPARQSAGAFSVFPRLNAHQRQCDRRRCRAVQCRRAGKGRLPECGALSRLFLLAKSA